MNMTISFIKMTFAVLFLAIIFCFVPCLHPLRAAVAENEIIDSSSQVLLENDLQIIKPGVLPSSFWYWSDIFGEEIRYLFTIGGDNKAGYLVDMADERLAELRELTHEGINDFNDQLKDKYGSYIDKAEQMVGKAKVDSIIKAKEMQVELEKEILHQESQLKNQAKNAPKQYDKTLSGAVSKIGAWFGTVLEHLSWKRKEIKNQREDLGY